MLNYNLLVRAIDCVVKGQFSNHRAKLVEMCSRGHFQTGVRNVGMPRCQREGQCWSRDWREGIKQRACENMGSMCGSWGLTFQCPRDESGGHGKKPPAWRAVSEEWLA